MSRCIDVDGIRTVPGRHHPDCDDAGCAGCVTCTESHCALGCWRHCDDQHPEVCPTCVGKVRDRLARILELCDLLPDEAAHHSQDSAAGATVMDVMGGDALVCLGPWSTGLASMDALDDADWHPLLTLATWADSWAEWLGVTPPKRATVWSEVDFLGEHLTLMAQEVVRTVGHTREVEFAPDFSEFAADVRELVGRLEGLLAERRTPQRSRVRCINPDCEPNPPRLMRVYGETARFDHHRCPQCRRVYSAGEYVQAQHQAMASEGAERWVPWADALDILRRMGRPEQTVRRWLGDLLLSPVCEVGTRRVLVWWPEAWRLHRETPTRKRLAS